MDNNIKESMDKIGRMLATPLFPVNVEAGKVYTVKQDIASMDTWYMMKLINRFLNDYSKINVHIEVFNVGKKLPLMEDHPYIVIESSAKGIIKAKNNLSKRKYVSVLENDFIESDNLALMVISVIAP